MSGVVCALSGVVAEDPVYAKSGYIYERRIIEKHIDMNGKCPISGMELNKNNDLLPINQEKVAKLRVQSSSSIPGLLSMMQSEWDSLITESYALKTHLDTVRNQLSHSLYQHDAATRVISRLIKERDEARACADEMQKQLADKQSIQFSHTDILPGISEDLEIAMQDLAKKLLATRKKRHVEGLVTLQSMKTLKCRGDYPLHSSSSPGISALSIFQKNENILATGGVDSNIVVFDMNAKKTLNKLHGHTKKINDVKFLPQECILLSASDDKTVRVWKANEDDFEFRCSHIIRKHRGAVQCLSIHPLNEYVATCGMDKSWAFHEIHSGKTLQISTDLPCDYGCVSFHPDGMILGGGGMDGSVHIWDMKGTKFRASLVGHNGPINSLSFSENGYYLATASEDGNVRLWDLRKSLSFQVIKNEESKPMKCVTFDNSGQYIAIGSSNLSVYHFETRTNATLVKSFDDHSDSVTDVEFAPRASFLVSTSMDRTVRIWKPNVSNQKNDEDDK